MRWRRACAPPSQTSDTRLSVLGVSRPDPPKGGAMLFPQALPDARARRRRHRYKCRLFHCAGPAGDREEAGWSIDDGRRDRRAARLRSQGRRRGRSRGLVTETQRRIAAEAWAFRTRVEREAADRFTRLATTISRFDAASPLPAMMQRAGGAARRSGSPASRRPAANAEEGDLGAHAGGSGHAGTGEVRHRRRSGARLALRAHPLIVPCADVRTGAVLRTIGGGARLAVLASAACVQPRRRSTGC